MFVSIYQPTWDYISTLMSGIQLMYPVLTVYACVCLKDATATLFREISDFLVQGNGQWFEKTGSSVTFNDAAIDPPTQGEYRMAHYRY